MRNFVAQTYAFTNKSQNNTSSLKANKPDWMKRLQEKNKKDETVHQSKNIDLILFPSATSERRSSEITYLEDEDDLAASYFPGCGKVGSSMSSINIDDLPPVSGYNFEERFQKKEEEEEKNNKKEKVARQSTKNIDYGMFPSATNESQSTEITYLEDEDDLAASYFPKCDKRGSTMGSSISIDDLPPVSGYNFGKLVDE